MHFGKPWHQVTVGTIDDGCIFGNRYVVDGTNGGDCPVAHDHGLLVVHDVGSHRYDIDVDECRCFRRQCRHNQQGQQEGR